MVAMGKQETHARSKLDGLKQKGRLGGGLSEI
jgi:hypothetical protein